MIKKLSKKKLRHLRTGHVALWTWLAADGDTDKGKWPGWTWNGGEWSDARCSNLCLACEAATSGCLDASVDCPIDWGCGAGGCLETGSAFDLWCFETDRNKRKRIAAQIATMWPEVE